VNALLDTNVVLRYTNHADPAHGAVRGYLDGFSGSGGVAHICAQTITEFWAIATRPVEANGLGFRAARAREEVEVILGAWPLLTDPASLLDRWLDLCTVHEVAGRKAFDTRLVALMMAHEVTVLVTLNPQDFVRYAGITLLVPGSTTPAPTPRYNGPASAGGA
jgi:predicted nucleic acid-binding protein